MEKEKWIYPYLRRYRWQFILAGFLGTMTILFGAGLMFTSGYLISKAATQPESILMVYVPIVGVRTFGIGRAVLSYAERLTGHSIILKVLSEMRIRLYKIIEPQAFFLRSRFRTGDVLGVLADDIEHLQDFYLKTLFPSLVSIIIYALIIICAGMFSLPFALTLAGLMGLILFIGPLFSFLYTRALNDKLKIGRHQLYYQFTDAVFGISDWIFSGNHSSFIRRNEKQEQQLFLVEARKLSFVNWRDVANQIVLGTIVVMTIAWANGLTMSGEIPSTLIAAFGLVLLSLVESFLPIASAVSETATYHDSLKRLDSIESDKSQVMSSAVVMPDTLSIAQVTLELNKLSFGYHQNEPLLKDVTLKVEQGEKIAIIGRSGSGKSTLLNLIQGALEPTSGEVRINGLNAMNLEPVIPTLMSVLNQKAYLFNTSVLNNIRLGCPEATDDEVYRVARMVQLEGLIETLPKGYQTNMQETGQRFSGGERQRIALARILLQNTPVVILDEPTVGLDPITEIALLNTIFTTLRDKTIIWVTHHLTGVENMGSIIFLDRGKIAMEGSHQQLLESEERYRRLYRLDCPLS
ncbi:thiol reductant ABC exporter subunit CydC [Neobacillus drentensis]|uniref:thiol reductant ABC exporter subunit CydC n=1 Tax=Neobacillus drentensis TaxID=220684 RepID=UPI0028627AE0|nr:thiol reductant ABC exporter subunit CydC [Neobacillus drentensis]MDR7238585.1 ATP-binding cassette subfamily C protein CydC [Neobacillus drentensis]